MQVSCGLYAKWSPTGLKLHPGSRQTISSSPALEPGYGAAEVSETGSGVRNAPTNSVTALAMLGSDSEELQPPRHGSEGQTAVKTTSERRYNHTMTSSKPPAAHRTHAKAGRQPARTYRHRHTDPAAAGLYPQDRQLIPPARRV